MIHRDFRYFDFPTFLLITILACIGILSVYSASYTDQVPYSIFLKKQLFGLLTGYIIFFIISFIDYKKLYRFGYVVYFILIGLLIFTLIKGKVALGGQRWINIGLFKFQPSELIKLFFPAYVVYFLETQSVSPVYKLNDFSVVLSTLMISFFLIRKQPDLGTAIIILLAGFMMFWLAGIKKSFFIWIFLFLVVTAPLTWHFLKPYQKKRIEVFLGSGQSHKERYQIEQSTIAIGSGGFFGKGFLQGTQNRFDFLPENHTDFIFSVICEEWGFAGAIVILILFLLLFFRVLLKIQLINCFYAKLLAMGLISPMIISSIINICMVIGLLPIVGIPLPFLSYGVSHLWVTFASFGWINSIIIRNNN